MNEINVIDKYFSLNRNLLLILGLWPYEKSKCVQLHIACIFSILISGIIFQLTSLLTSDCTANFILKTLSFTFSFSTFIIKYNAFYINSNTIKCLMEQVQYIYKDLKDNNEIAIVKKYASSAKKYTIILLMIILLGVFIFVNVQLWSDLTYIILSTNTSKIHQMQITTEYFVNHEKYFYLLFFHINTVMVIGCIIIAATGTMLIACLQHACGMFKIASYRIERAIRIYVSKNFNMQKEILVYKSIIHAIDIHRKAMIFSNYLISSFEISFMFLIIIGVLTLSLNLFRVFQTLLFEHSVEEFFINLIIASFSVIYMFMSNFVGQQIIDHHNHIFATTYKTQWYITSLHIQKLVLFMLQRGNKSFGLCVGGLFIASIECFATLTNASVSYFTLMYSMR